MFFPEVLNEAHPLTRLLFLKASTSEPISNNKNFNRDQVRPSTGPRHRADAKEAEVASLSTGTRGLKGKNTPKKRCSIMICGQKIDWPRKKEGTGYFCYGYVVSLKLKLLGMSKIKYPFCQESLDAN